MIFAHFRHNLFFRKSVSLFIILFFAVTSLTTTTPVFAQSSSQPILNLPVPGAMLAPSQSFTPPIMAGMTIHPDNPLKFDFIIDTGDDNLQGEAFHKESQKLINYFLATLTVPDDEMWVNLSPYEKDRIIADGLGGTEMGRDMLAQDYLLKQFTASLMYPEEELGDAFWQRIYEKSQAKLGTTDIPANTFNKVWIAPQEAVVFVSGTNAFVSKSHLKVFLEEDYLALESNRDSTKHGLGDVTKDDLDVMSQDAKDIIREVILPEIEKEVNYGKNFANLRQIYHSMILATWYKKNLKESILGHVYVNKNKINGIDLEDKTIKEKIYNQYVEAFKKGVYDYIKEDYDPATQQVVQRKYFSGGLSNAAQLTVAEDQIDAAAIAGDRQTVRAFQGIYAQQVTSEIPLRGGDGDVIDTDQKIDDSDAATPSALKGELRIKLNPNLNAHKILGTDSFGTTWSETRVDLKDPETVRIISNLIKVKGVPFQLKESDAQEISIIIAEDRGISGYKNTQVIGLVLDKYIIQLADYPVDYPNYLARPAIKERYKDDKFDHIKHVFKMPAKNRSLNTQKDKRDYFLLDFEGQKSRRWQLRVEDFATLTLLVDNIGTIVMSLGVAGSVVAGVYWSNKDSEELQPVMKKTVDNKAMLTNRDTDQFMPLPDESTAKTIFVLVERFTSNPTGFSSRDTFVYKELLMRGLEKVEAAAFSFLSDLGASVDISESSGEAMIRWLYSQGVIGYVEGSAVPADAAVLNGGIDFNPGMMNFQEQGQGLDFNVDNALLNNIPENAVHSVSPVIINITPIIHFAPLLGRVEDDPAQQQLSFLK